MRYECRQIEAGDLSRRLRKELAEDRPEARLLR